LDKVAQFIRPEVVATGFTQEELESADELTILGNARTSEYDLTKKE
jgi:hypothetical protein